MDKMGPELSILVVIPVYNRPGDLNNLIKSIQRIDKNNYELIIAIIDDGSDVPVAMKQDWGNHIQIFRNNDRRRGPACSRNMAVEKIISDYIWFLDSDTEVFNPAVLTNMIGILRSNSRICAAGGIVEEVQGKNMVLAGKVLMNFMFVYDAFPPDEYPPQTVFGLSSTNLLISRENFLSVNGFDERLEREEDADLCLKLKKKGFLFYQGNNTVVLHRLSNAGRAKSHAAHYESQYMFLKTLLKTRLLMMAKHAPDRLVFLPLLDFFISFQLIFRIACQPHHLKRIKLAGDTIKLSEVFSIMFLLVKDYLLGLKLFFSNNA